MSEYSVKDDLLYKDGIRVSQRPSPNIGNVIKPKIVVIHYTGDNSLEGALSWLTTRKSRVSAHLVISKEGVVYQLVPFNREAWHAGISSYDGRRSVNSFSIGIECVGFGDVWPEAQLEAIREVLVALEAAYHIADIVGHSDVAPGRKVDPGPRFPWSAVTVPVGGEEVPAPVAKPAPKPAPPVPAIPPKRPAGLFSTILSAIFSFFKRKK